MAELIIYLLKVSACLILFYSLYAITLRKETHFRFNRIYLLFSIALAHIIPVLSLPEFSKSSGFEFTGILKTVQVGTNAFITSENSASYINYIFIVYLTGCFILFIKFVAKCISLAYIYQQCKIENRGSLNIALSKKSIAPFSFLHTIFMDEKLKIDPQIDKIMQHETVHIRQLHSLDIICAEIICMLIWFNPVSWKLKTALKETHEYLADSESLDLMSNTEEYFQLLIKNVVGMQPELANNFNKSLTLKRLNMMKKTRSSKRSMLKVLLVLPIVALLLVSFSCTNSANEPNSQNETISQKNEKSAMTIEQMPEFKGGQEAMNNFILANVKYPDEAKKSGIEGKVFITFTVTKSGKLDKIVISKKVNALLDAEAMRVVSMMPDWIPGKNKGESVDVEMTLPIAFKLAEK